MAEPASLVEWLRARGLLRGPFLYADYWAVVLGLHGRVPDRQVREGLVDPSLFRIGLDRPDLELPRTRYYLLLFLAGPLLAAFRGFRRLGRYRIRLREHVGEAVLRQLAPYRLDLEEGESGRVDVRHDGRVLARDVLDPRRIAGFASLFYPAYKLPLASLTGILAAVVAAPLLDAAGWLDAAARWWVPVGFPALVLLLYAVFRDWPTAVGGALPVLLARWLLPALHPAAVESWAPFLWAMGGLFALYLVAVWLFLPRPVPPVLMLYTAEGPGRPHAREEDAPWWLEGRAYWVWRYLVLTPAELNKFWERDWERVELWIRADGPEAGALEWVVTDAHYRELWIPYGKLDAPSHLERQREDALAHGRDGGAGTWIVEVDAHLVFHTPFVRAASFVPEEGDVPVLSLRHLARALFRRGHRDPTEGSIRALDMLRIRRGAGILDDLPEAVTPLVARHLVAQPWAYWRYPLGAHRRWERRLYEERPDRSPPPAADPELQIKAERGGGPTSPGPAIGVAGGSGGVCAGSASEEDR